MRFFVIDVKYIGSIVDVIHASLSPYLADSEIENESDGALIHKVQYDTYNREIERYSKKYMELSEQLFYHDSIMTIQLINLLKGKDEENLKWQLALKAVDELLNSFQYALEEKQELMKILQDNFGNEFNINNDFRRQFGKNYRAQRIQIEQMLEMKYSVDKEGSKLLSPIIHKSKQIKEIAIQILQGFNPENINSERDRLLTSYIHMLINRIFRTNQRKYELVLYDYHSGIMMLK